MSSTSKNNTKLRKKVYKKIRKEKIIMMMMLPIFFEKQANISLMKETKCMQNNVNKANFMFNFYTVPSKMSDSV